MPADDFREQQKGKPPAMATVIKKLAERVGFEPTVQGLLRQLLSREPHSTTLAPLRTEQPKYIEYLQIDVT